MILTISILKMVVQVVPTPPYPRDLSLRRVFDGDVVVDRGDESIHDVAAESAMHHQEVLPCGNVLVREFRHSIMERADQVATFYVVV